MNNNDKDYLKIMAIQLNGILAGIAGLVSYQLSGDKKDLKEAGEIVELVIGQLEEETK